MKSKVKKTTREDQRIGLHRTIVQRMSPRCANARCRQPIKLGEIVNELFERVTERLERGEEVRIHGFGTFTSKFVAGSKIKSLKGETVITKGRLRVTFKESRSLKARLAKNGGST